MARLEISGMDELDAALNRMGKIPDEVKRRALDRMASIGAERIKATGEAMDVRDPESQEHILDRIKTTKAKLSSSGGYEDITFSGTRTRGQAKTRNAEIAFINEYGKRGQPARPFISQAMTANEDKIAAAGGDVLGDWIETEFSR